MGEFIAFHRLIRIWLDKIPTERTWEFEIYFAVPSSAFLWLNRDWPIAIVFVCLLTVLEYRREPEFPQNTSRTLNHLAMRTSPLMLPFAELVNKIAVDEWHIQHLFGMILSSILCYNMPVINGRGDERT